METLRKAIDLLTPHERMRALLLLGMVLIMAFLDVVGVAFIMPFMSVLSNPGIVQTNLYLRSIYEFFGFSDEHQFLIFLGVAVFLALIISIGFKALTTWAILRFTYSREYSIGRRLVMGYLHQPYEWFLRKHSADLGKSVMAEVAQVTNGTLVPLMNLIAKGVVVIALLALLVITEPWLALGVGATFGLTYGGIFMLVRRRLSLLGRARSETIKQRFRALSEAFGGIKDVKASNSERVFFTRYDEPARQHISHQVKAQLTKGMPRFVIEAVAFGGMIVVILYLMTTRNDLQSVLPVTALYALAGYRLMPALQEVYASATLLRYNRSALDNLHRELMQLPAVLPRAASISEPLELHDVIELNQVSYQYPEANRLALNAINLRIPARTSVGLVGTTGSGKTTTADLILGLLIPQSGELRVDGIAITDANRPRWQSTIGYVPQQIYLTDDTLSANIAFGVPRKYVDHAAVEKAARMANLHEFISQELPHGYDTLVGERGVRLSGGQRQRIGLARALYHQPQVLILDEATSALDNLTEQAVMESLRNLNHQITIIIIAHRLSTVRECDQIVVLTKGKVESQGSFEKLLHCNAHFRAMVESQAI